MKRFSTDTQRCSQSYMEKREEGYRGDQVEKRGHQKGMARVNINISGISELQWTGMGEFKSDDHYIYHCEQESLRRNGLVLIVNKRVPNAVLGCNLKNERMISVHFQG